LKPRITPGNFTWKKDRMNIINAYIGKFGSDIAVWVAALIIVLLEFQNIKNFLAFILMKFYEFFIQHNAGE